MSKFYLKSNLMHSKQHRRVEEYGSKSSKKEIYNFAQNETYVAMFCKIE